MGTELSGYSECDLADDCADGSDEADCGDTYEFLNKCRNVDEWFSGTGFCDGVEDCSDGSDELGCDVLLECTLGGDAVIEINVFQYCDGFVSCDDGSDEPEGCAMAVCG